MNQSFNLNHRKTAFNLEGFYQRVEARLTHKIALEEEDGDHQMDQGRKIPPTKGLTPAAVLIPIVEKKNRAEILFTTRTLALKSHSGQVAFPGGKIDDGDLSQQSAALRETHEEIGIPPSAIEIMATMPLYKSTSGYAITPVLGKVIGSPQLSLNRDEVEDCFTTPLDFLMDENNHKMESKIWQGSRRYYYTMPYKDGQTSRLIWGVTAGIIRRLYERLYL